MSDAVYFAQYVHNVFILYGMLVKFLLHLFVGGVLLGISSTINFTTFV